MQAVTQTCVKQRQKPQPQTTLDERNHCPRVADPPPPACHSSPSSALLPTSSLCSPLLPLGPLCSPFYSSSLCVSMLNASEATKRANHVSITLTPSGSAPVPPPYLSLVVLCLPAVAAIPSCSTRFAMQTTAGVPRP